MLISVQDGLSHRAQSGYGALARHLILGLADRGHEVVVQSGSKAWMEVEPGAREKLEDLRAEASVPPVADVVLQTAIPPNCRRFAAPSVFYTQNALGGLRRDWLEPLGRADHLVVPGEFDRRVFARHFSSVSVSPQGSNPHVFKPVPRWRMEGSHRFTFLYVGSYSFRKGVDVLLASFLDEFDEREAVELWLHCVGMGTGDNINHLLRTIQSRRPLANVRVSAGSRAPAWMCRHYNQADCVITASRGEGWCMPLTEGLLCGKPVIAPNSTAPGEYLGGDAAYLVPVVERQAAAISDSFGGAFRERCGEDNITYYEPDSAALRAAMRAVFADPDEAARRASAGGAIIRDQYDWRSAVDGVEDALLRTAEAGPAPVTPSRSSG